MELFKKTFLDANDICVIFSCGKNKAYEIINLINDQLAKAGYMTFPGKVLASALYRFMDMKEQLEMHKKAWETGDLDVKNNNDTNYS